MSPPTTTRAEAVQVLLATPTGRRRLSRESVSFYDTHYCGMEPAAHRKGWLEKIVRARRRAKAKGRQEKVLLLGPRKHGKSETAVSVSSLFICEDRSIRILIVGNKASNASKRLRRVKKILESKPVQDDWCSGSKSEGLGPFRDRDAKWGDYVIEVVRPDAMGGHIDPTLEASGRDGSITGGHFDVIILDDVEDVKHVKNSRIRRETKEWFQETLLPILEPDGLLLVIGTRKHRDDLYSAFIEDDSFDVIHDRAILEEPDSVEPVYEIVDGAKKLVDVRVVGGRALWPRSSIGPVSRRRGIEFVYRVKLSYRDPRLFTREWQNDVLDDEERMFRSEWVRAGEELGAKVSLYTGLAPRPDPFPPRDGAGWRARWPDMVVAQAWDLSLIMDEREAEEKDSDYAVGITAGWEPTTDRNWLMGIRRTRGKDPDELQSIIVEERLRFPQWDTRREGVPFVRAIGVEKNSFGAIHTWGLTKMQTPFGKLPIVPHTTTSKKADPWEGIPAMKHTWKVEGIVVPSATSADRIDTRAFRDEFLDFGVAEHDDCVLAFWIWCCVMRVVKAEWTRMNARRNEARTSVGRRRAKRVAKK